MSDMHGRRALITGSSLGIGYEVAKLLASRGVSIVLNASGQTAESTLNLREAARSLAGIGGHVVPVAADIAQADECRRLVDVTVSELGGIDILINNAGAHNTTSVTNTSLDEWRRVMATNLDAPFYLARFAAPHMKAQRFGRIVNAASNAAFGNNGGASYPASKCGVLGLTWAMARDLGMYGITVNAYNPQARSRMSEGDHPGRFEQILRERLGRGLYTQENFDFLLTMGGPESIVPWVAFLCSDAAHFINGEVFLIESRRIAAMAQPAEAHRLTRDVASQGPWELDELRETAAAAFPLANRWPAMSDDEIARWELAETPGGAG